MSGPLFTKWFWPDWLSDQGLRACSHGARGVWMDMLCLAAANQPYGYIGVNGSPLTPSNLARVTGVEPKVCRALMAELEKHGVFSRDESGQIYCRRMVREARLSEQNRKNGRRGGNPKLLDDKPKSGALKRQAKGGVPPSGRKPLAIEPTDSPPKVGESVSEPDGSAIVVCDDARPIRPIEAMGAYNRVAVDLDLPVAVSLNDKRRKAIGARLKEHPGSWGAAMTALRRAPWLHGKNDKGFKADLDFVVQPKSYTRLIEGFYEGLTDGKRTDADRKTEARRELMARSYRAAVGEPEPD